MGEEEAWSDLAAVMEESIHGQDDVRTSLARPYVLRLYAHRASDVLARGRQVWTLAGAGHRLAAGVIRAGIAVIVVAGLWAMATDRIDGARLTAVWLLALGFGGTVEHISRMVPELQYALGAWGRVQLLRDPPQEPAGGARPDRGRPGRAGPDVPLSGRQTPAAAPPARREPDVLPRPVLRAHRPHRLRQVDPGQGADPRRRRAARHGLPRRHRHRSTWTSRRCAGGSPSCRSAPRSSPAPSRRTSPCSTPRCCERAARRWTSSA